MNTKQHKWPTYTWELLLILPGEAVMVYGNRSHQRQKICVRTGPRYYCWLCYRWFTGTRLTHLSHLIIYWSFLLIIIMLCYIFYLLCIAGTNYWRNRVIKVASEFKGKVLNFAIASKGDFPRVLEDIGSKSEDQHTVLITSDDGSKYVMKETFRYSIKHKGTFDKNNKLWE